MKAWPKHNVKEWYKVPAKLMVQYSRLTLHRKECMANKRLQLQPTSQNYCKTKTMALCDLHVGWCTQNKNAANVDFKHHWPSWYITKVNNSETFQKIPENVSTICTGKWKTIRYWNDKKTSVCYFDSETASSE